MLGAPRLVGHAIALLQIGPRAERLVARAGQHHDACVGIARQPLEAGEQVFAERRVQRVPPLGPVDRHRDDVTVGGARDEKVPVGHAQRISFPASAEPTEAARVRDGSFGPTVGAGCASRPRPAGHGATRARPQTEPGTSVGGWRSARRARTTRRSPRPTFLFPISQARLGHCPRPAASPRC